MTFGELDVGVVFLCETLLTTYVKTSAHTAQRIVRADRQDPFDEDELVIKTRDKS